MAGSSAVGLYLNKNMTMFGLRMLRVPRVKNPRGKGAEPEGMTLGRAARIVPSS